MYCLAEKHLSSIQKAIQSAHAIVEYGLTYGNTPEYKQWAKKDKTIVILDGGNSIDLDSIKDQLRCEGWPFEVFYEPDMDNFMTAIAFLAPDRVYDYKNWGVSYDDYREKVYPGKAHYDTWLNDIGGKPAEAVKSIISSLRIAI
jgi:hypothetical protein